MKCFFEPRLALLLMTFAGTVWAAEPVQFKLSTLGMEGSAQMDTFHKAEKEIFEKTGGAVTFKIYPGGAMGTGETLFRKMKFNQLDGGSFTAGEASQYCPDLRVPSLTFLFDSIDQVDYVLPLLAKDFARTFEGNGYILLALVETGFSYIMSVEPVRNVSDLQARSVWLPSDDWVGQLEFKEFNVTPKPMSLPQATTGLMTGMIDTVEGPFIAAVGLQWMTKIKYVLDVPLLYTFSVVLVSKKSFEKISPEHQAIVKESFASHFEKDLLELARKDNAEAREALVKKGVQFLNIQPEAVKTFAERLKVARKEIEAKGVFTPGIIGKVEDLILAYSSKTP